MIEQPPPLSPIFVDSFAYNTFKDRLPVTLAKIVDSLYRNKKIIMDDSGADKIDCLKFITSDMSRLRHELTTNKPLATFDECIFGDEKLWNHAILEEKIRLIEAGCIENELIWFKCSFLFGECYMYRRIYDSVLKSGFKEFDQFIFEKMELLQKAMQVESFFTGFLHTIWPLLASCSKSQLCSYFETMIKMSLWGNEADLSLSISDDDSKLKLESPEKTVEENNNKLLIDDYRNVFELLFELKRLERKDVVVSIFVDNSGSEFLADLHFVEFLLASNLAQKVVLFVKTMPWYVSDVTERDAQLTVKHLCESNNTTCEWLGRQIQSRIAESSLSIRSHEFLCLPYPFCKIPEIFPDLYSELSRSSLLIFKGDLNYRKLVSDLQWPVLNTTFYDSLLGFHPAPLVALRVLKCDVQVALTSDVLSRVEKECPDDWMISSRYGVIQTCLVHD